MAKRGLTITKTDIIVVYLLIVLAIVVWAPWKLEHEGYVMYEYYPLWSSPTFYKIDATRLFTELSITTLILGGIFYIVSSKKAK